GRLAIASHACPIPALFCLHVARGPAGNASQLVAAKISLHAYAGQLDVMRPLSPSAIRATLTDAACWRMVISAPLPAGRADDRAWTACLSSVGTKASRKTMCAIRSGMGSAAPIECYGQGYCTTFVRRRPSSCSWVLPYSPGANRQPEAPHERGQHALTPSV